MMAFSDFDREVKITRNPEPDSDSGGSSFTFDQGDGDNPDTGIQTVIDAYPCFIKGTVSYETNEQGDTYKGKLKMVGSLTDMIQEGDIVDGKYKVAGEPDSDMEELVTKCNLVKLG
jgi:hypothetical protein